MSNRGKSLHYLPALDGLRALAVIAVLIFHMSVEWPVVGAGGEAGVDVFFVLSGFLITSILLKQRERTGSIDLRTFYFRRVVRLWPALAVVVIVMLIPGLLLAPDPGRYLGESASAFFYLTPFTAPLLEWAQAYLHTWTLGLEEYFYLVFPLLLILLFRMRLSHRSIGYVLLAAGTGMLVIVAAAPVVMSDPPWPLNYLRVGGIAVGCALGVAFSRRRLWGPAWCAPAGLILVAAGMWIVSLHGQTAGIGYPVVVLGTCGVVAAAGNVQKSGVLTALSWRPLVLIGVVSYELYLWHHVIRRVGSWATGASFAETALWAYPLSVALAFGTHYALKPLQERWRTRLGAGTSPVRAEPTG